MKIYHNPRCHKSRATLAIINEAGQEPEIIEYLKTPPSKKELKQLLKMLGMKAEDIVRKQEPIYKEKFKGKELSNEAWIDAMVAHPKLMQRPIVVQDGRAILGRPPENVKDLL